jgi:regulator of protease activity HflC (stomatin/prohibitin superfamily)
MAWVIFLVVALPLLGFLLWTLFDESFVRIEPGKLGLVLVKGRATDTALLPGPHWVPAFRRRMVAEYPSLELAYRAGEADPGEGGLAKGGPALHVVLADRTEAKLSFTVRFRLEPASLRTVHERFGPEGVFAAVRDRSERTLRATLAASGHGIEALFGPQRVALETELGGALAEVLQGDGFTMTMFGLGDVDLGPTGDVIQATVRARLELEREEAQAATRLARVRHDAELQPYLSGPGLDAALRYREVDVWREVLQARPERTIPPSRPPRTPEPLRPSEPSGDQVPEPPTVEP